MRGPRALGHCARPQSPGFAPLGGEIGDNDPGACFAERKRRRSLMATYALIPGAGGDGSYWHLVVPELEAAGHAAIAVDLPSGDDRAGWAEYADTIERAIGDRSDLVLVAQSLAGFS